MTSLVFTTGNDVVSKLIKWLTRSPVSHVAICESLYGVPVLIHATIGGVQVSHRAKWLRSRKMVAEFEFFSRNIDLAGAVNHIGERYDYVGLFGFAPVLIARWLGRKIKNPFASPHATVCSELVLRADCYHAVREWRGLDPEQTSPADLYEICRSSESFKVMNPNGAFTRQGPTTS